MKTVAIAIVVIENIKHISIACDKTVGTASVIRLGLFSIQHVMRGMGICVLAIFSVFSYPKEYFNKIFIYKCGFILMLSTIFN